MWTKSFPGLLCCLLEQMDPQSCRLHTETKLSQTKQLGGWFSQSSLLLYIHPLAISFKLNLSQLVTNVSHYKILKLSWQDDIVTL